MSLSSIEPITFWAALAAVASFISALAALGFLRREHIVKTDLHGRLHTTKQERDDLRTKLNQANERLSVVDPERFLDRINDLYDEGEFEKAEDAAGTFTTLQSEAFGRAAEILTEQSIIDSEKYGKDSIEDALRFVQIGLAAQPDSQRLVELHQLVHTRRAGFERGEPPETLNWEGLSDVELNRLSMGLSRDGKYVLAEIAARRSVPLARLRTGKMSPNFAAALGNHASCLNQLRQYKEAESLFDEVLEIDRATIGEGHPLYATHLNNLALVVRAQGRFEEAEDLFREALKIDRATIGEGHPDYASNLSNLALMLNDLGRFEEAEDLLREGLEIDRATNREGHPSYAIHLNNLALLMNATNRFEEARPLYEQALAILETTLPADHPDIAAVKHNLAALNTPDDD